MGEGENLRRLTSLSSVARKLADFTRFSLVNPNPELVRARFSTVRRDVLLAIANRRPFPLDASIVEMSGDGTIDLPPTAWTSDEAYADWPGPIQLLDASGGIAEPQPRSGIEAYCIWSNLTDARGVAVVRDLSSASGEIEFLEEQYPDPDDDDVEYYLPRRVPDMHRAGNRRARGAAISVPIFVESSSRENNGHALNCAGSLNIKHRSPGYFCEPANYVWAQQCGNLVGQLYRACRDRLARISELTDSQALDETMTESRVSTVSRISRTNYDWQQMRKDVERVMLQEKLTREDVSRKIGVCSRTLRWALNRGKLGDKTAELIVAFLSRYMQCTLEDYVIKPTRADRSR